MSIRDDWVEYRFSEDEVQDIRSAVESKNKRLAYSNFENKIDTRWCGIAMEVAFKNWLDKRQIQYTHWTGKTDYDDCDFTVGNLNIDVKAISTKYLPRYDYGCDVVEKQWSKIIDKKAINALVFGRFVLKINVAIIMGWLTVDEFKERCKFQEKGTKLGAITIENNQYEVQVKDLWSLHQLFTYLQFGFVV